MLSSIIYIFINNIVEFEKGGAARAELYGKALMPQLSKQLREQGLKGISPTSLRKFRQFYQSYKPNAEIEQALSRLTQVSQKKIQQTVSVESFPLVLANRNDVLTLNIYPLLSGQFHLSWSHYVELLSIDDEDERRFYEIEAKSNSWSVRELQLAFYAAYFKHIEA